MATPLLESESFVPFVQPHVGVASAEQQIERKPQNFLPGGIRPSLDQCKKRL